MAIGRTFPECFQKGAALARERPARASTATRPRRPTTASTTTSCCGARRAPRPSGPSSSRRRCAGASRVEQVHDGRGSTRGSSTRSSPSPRSGPTSPRPASPAMTRRDWRRAKRLGFADAQLAYLWGVAEAEVRAARLAAGVRATFKTVDTCAAEFEAETPYHYSTYEDDDEVGRATGPRSSSSARAPTASARASSSTTAASTPASPCATPASRRSWSTATPRPCRPTTTPATASTSSRSPARTCST